MNKKNQDQHLPTLPSKEQVLEALEQHSELRTKRDLTRYFAIKGDLRSPFKKLIRTLEDDGLLARKGKTMRRARELPRVTVLDILSDCDPDALMAHPANWLESEGKPPLVRIEVKRNDRTIPGPGDRILARIFKETDQRDNYSAHAMKILVKPRRGQIGIVRLDANGARLIPIDRKQKEMRIGPHDLNNAKDGDLVEVQTSPKGRLMIPSAKVTAIVGNPMSEGAVSLIALHNLEIPYRFPADVLKAANNAKPATADGREDWRDIDFVTIDPASAKDHDDAVFAKLDTDDKNPGGYIVYVAIADVAAYVTPGSTLDKEAYLRGNSVYFPDRVVPMLPERISNDLCSLREGEDRPALALRMVIDKNGNKISHSFHRVMMRIAVGLSYTEAQAAFDGYPEEDKAAAFSDNVLTPLWNAYKAMAKARDKRGPLDLDLPERKIVLNKDGHVDRVFVPERREANRLIEELMVGANVCAAETLEQNKIPLIYRVHDQPGPEKLLALKDFLGSLDVKFSTSAAIKPAHFNQILHKAKGTDNSIQVSEMVLRSQAQAEYNPVNYGHFGLNLARYAHFTSPIRRYADLIVHRALITALGLGKGGLASTDPETLAQVAQHISGTERRAMAAERQTTDRLIAHYLSDSVGANFPGKISGVTKSGLFVQLDETGADGFIPASTLGRDYFHHIEEQQAMIGERTGERFRLGDNVRVKLVESAPIAGSMRFEMISEGERVTPIKRGRGSSRQTSKNPRKGNFNKGKRRRR